MFAVGGFIKGEVLREVRDGEGEKALANLFCQFGGADGLHLSCSWRLDFIC